MVYATACFVASKLTSARAIQLPLDRSLQETLGTSTRRRRIPERGFPADRGWRPPRRLHRRTRGQECTRILRHLRSKILARCSSSRGRTCRFRSRRAHVKLLGVAEEAHAYRLRLSCSLVLYSDGARRVGQRQADDHDSLLVPLKVLAGADVDGAQPVLSQKLPHEQGLPTESADHADIRRAHGHDACGLHDVEEGRGVHFVRVLAGTAEPHQCCLPLRVLDDRGRSDVVPQSEAEHRTRDFRVALCHKLAVVEHRGRQPDDTFVASIVVLQGRDRAPATPPRRPPRR
eukprot:scaffold1021_cov241-Pinguiococcus_pyrenoidosus.AAC.13